MSDAIEVEGLTKSFAATRALDGITLNVASGSVLGLLGPNGSGKTTTVRILATLLRADAGTARIAGFDVRHQAPQVRRLIGLTGQYAAVDERLTGFENLRMIARLLDLRRAEARARADELLDRFDLSDVGGRLVKTYSGGMRRRLDLAASLVGHPRVLFLDEPTTGLDPHSRNQVWGMVRELVADGTTVLLTTQYLDEADQLAVEIAVLDAGRVIARGTADELKRQTGGQVLEIRPADTADLVRTAATLDTLAATAPTVDRERGCVEVPADDPLLIAVAVRRLDDAGVGIADAALRRPSLDDVFLHLTGHRTQPPSADREPPPGEASPSAEREPHPGGVMT